MMTRLFGLLLFALLASGCASKPSSYVVLMESPDGSTGAITVSTAQGTTLVNRKQQGVMLDGKAAQTAVPVEPQRIAADFTPALNAQPALPVSYLLYFKSGGAVLTDESKQALQEVLKTIISRGPSAVSVIGHTDTESGAAWNEKIGQKRAETIAKLLRDNGVQVLELVVTSHGERNLLVKTPDDTAEPKNRRVEVLVR